MKEKNANEKLELLRELMHDPDIKEIVRDFIRRAANDAPAPRERPHHLLIKDLANYTGAALSENDWAKLVLGYDRDKREKDERDFAISLLRDAKEELNAANQPGAPFVKPRFHDEYSHVFAPYVPQKKD